MIYSATPSNGAQSSQHPSMQTLRGPQPGLLDPSQPLRLLRFPESKLSFASFDPKTALAVDPSTKNSGDLDSRLAPPKRIVIETTPQNASFWRFVPRARLEEGAQDEGIWPRVIVICGERVHCYQEQWELYKLDPKYLCVVYPWPKCSTVTPVELPNQDYDITDPYSGKRSRWSSPETSEPITQKKARPRFPDETDESDFESDEDEVEGMIIDESFSQRSRYNRRPNATSREKLKKARQERWTKNRMAYEKQFQDITIPADGSFSMWVDSDNTLHSQNTRSTEENKRKGNTFQESNNDSDQMLNDRSPHRSKRARTSPPKMRNDVNRVGCDKRRLERLRKFDELNRQHQQKKFAEYSQFSFIPPESVSDVKEDDEAPASTTEASFRGTDGQTETPLEDKPSHETEIAESIRKLRELEKDRPMWEAQRKQREARERAEDQERLAKAERRRKEEQQQLREQREAAEREKRRAQEAERLTREEECRQREIRARRQRQRWESGPWTTHRALERYRMLCDEFDAAKFTVGQSVTFQDIPWPVLHAPSRLTVEDVDWSAVETFFATVKLHMRLQDYKEFVEKSHRRFHPDRWRARKIWAAVADEVERGYLEVAANTVAQAITPIWIAAKEK